MKAEALTCPGLFWNSWQLSVAGFAHAQLLHCCHSVQCDMTWVLLFVSLECYFVILKDALTSQLFKVDTGMINTRILSVFLHVSGLAGSRARYVDVLNPGGTKASGAVPAPSDLFAPLAPMPIPANMFVPNSGVWMGLWGGFMAIYGGYLAKFYFLCSSRGIPARGGEWSSRAHTSCKPNQHRPCCSCGARGGFQGMSCRRTQSSDSGPLRILSSSFTATVLKA